MSVLSNEDILRELGLNIYIYPFKTSNLKGASYNLTASKLAWDIKTKKSIHDAERNKLIIPAQTTVLIETLESIWVSSNISGTYHSKVSLVSKGLSHIGTTLDPEYLGSSLIALHNHSQLPIELSPEAETFATLKFHYLETEATIKAGNNPGRPEILYGFSVSSEEEVWLDEPFRNTPDALESKLIDAPDFKRLVDQRNRAAESLATASQRKLQMQRRMGRWKLTGLISFFFLFTPLLFAGFLSSKKDIYENTPWYDALINASYGVSTVAFVGFLTVAYKFLDASSDEN